jgi:hypothetical protein
MDGQKHMNELQQNKKNALACERKYFQVIPADKFYRHRH